MMKNQNDKVLSLEVLMEILNGLDSFVYVTELETDEILFVNNKLANQYGVEASDVTGKVCWKALPTGQPGRCSYCPVQKLDQNPEKVINWIHSSKITGRHYQKNDRIKIGRAHV